MGKTTSSDESVDFVDLPTLRLDEGVYELPQTAALHEKFTQYSIERSCDICLLSPTLRSEYLDHHALAALFQDMSTLTPVFIISPNTSIRERYEQLQNGLHYSTAKWPLATVRADHSLTYRTKHMYSDDAPPGVIFTRYSTRLPNDDISKEIRAVLYDEAVKLKEDRWRDFCEWRERNEIPSVIYFVRDPLGPVYQRIKDSVDFTWTWTPHGLRNVLDSGDDLFTSEEESAPPYTHKARQLLRHKADEQIHQTHLCKEGPIVKAFSKLWDDYDQLEKAADDIDENELYAAVGIAQRAINGFSRLLSKLEYSDNYRAEHGKATSLSGRIEQVNATMDGLSGNAAAGRTPIEHVHNSLVELKETITESGPRNWKRGAVLTAIQKVYEDDDHVIVVLPDEPERDALLADLRIEREKLYSQARCHVHLHTPRSLPNAEPADYVLLYGPPKYGHRWLLRTCHAKHVAVLTYPHELGLLHNQVSSLNEALREATPVIPRESDGDRPVILDSVSPPRLFPDDSDLSVPADPTRAGYFDGVSIDIPNHDDHDTEEKPSPFADYELVDNGERKPIDELIDDVAGEFATEEPTYTPGDSFRGESASDRSRADGAEKVENCVDVRFTTGRAIALRRTDKLEVVNSEAGATVEKPAPAIQPGEKIVVVNDREVVREAVERLLLDSGNLDLVGYARLWKNQLQTEIERQDDSLDQFIERLEDHGLDKYRRTYRDYYHGRISLPKAKKSLHAIAKAYDMDEVLEHFDEVWWANHKIRMIKNDLIDLLKKRARNALASESEGDYVLDDELDIRLSDFDATDEAGDPFVEVHTVSSISEEQSLPKSQIGRLRTIKS